MIELQDVEVVRGERHVLGPLSLSLRERRIGVIGANGSGKSTFARLLNGLILPAHGRVIVDKLDTAKDGDAVRRRVGFLFQNPDSQIIYPTVGEDVAFGLKRDKLGKKERSERVGAMLERLGLAGFEGRLVHELSGGERQLVALAGVAVMQPEILVLDEPTTLLDLRNVVRIMAAVDALDRQTFLVTHDLSLLEGFDRVLLFHEGTVIADADPGPVIDRYRQLMLG